MKQRTLALAGLAQAIEAVLQTAHEGHADEQLLEPALDSVFAIDSDSTESIYGGTARLRSGLQLLLAQLEGSGQRRTQANRIAFTVLQVERKLLQHPPLLRTLSEGIERLKPGHAESGSLHPDVQQALGDLYSETISSLTPRVLVQGDPNQLAQSAVVGRIRAGLLAAVRSAVLWRQVGGSWWDLLLRRGVIARCARELLLEMENR